MKMRKWTGHFVGLLMFAGISAGAGFAQSTDVFAKANEEYAAGRFREAIELYDGIVRLGEYSAALFYNVGNAQYRVGDLGQAILNYQRALTLEPFHPEAATNLRLVRDKAPALELRKTSVERIASWFTASQYTIAAAVSFWIAAFALAMRLMARSRSRAWTLIFVLALLVFGTCLFGLRTLETGSHGKALAIVIGNKIDARLATADNAGTVLALPPGSEIKILSTRGDWAYAELPNDLRGWIPVASAQRVRL